MPPYWTPKITIMKNHSPSIFQLQNRKLPAIAFVLLLAILFAATYEKIFITIPSGEVGVLWKRFGGTDNRQYNEGLHIINPFNIMYSYNVQVQARDLHFDALTNSGEPLRVTALAHFSPIQDQLHLLHRHIGPDYAERVIIPTLETEFRQLFGQSSANAFMLDQVNKMQEIQLSASSKLQAYYVQLNDFSVIRADLIQPALAN